MGSNIGALRFSLTKSGNASIFDMWPFLNVERVMGFESSGFTWDLMFNKKEPGPGLEPKFKGQLAHKLKPLVLDSR